MWGGLLETVKEMVVGEGRWVVSWGVVVSIVGFRGSAILWKEGMGWVDGENGSNGWQGGGKRGGTVDCKGRLRWLLIDKRPAVGRSPRYRSFRKSITLGTGFAT